MPRIEELWAYVAADPNPDHECVLGLHTAMGWMPLVGADSKRMQSLFSQARELAIATGTTVRLVRFTTRTDVEFVHRVVPKVTT